MEERKSGKMKVGAFCVAHCYSSIDRCCHGSQDSYAAYCLIEEDGKMYLGEVTSVNIETSDGAGATIDVDGYESIYELLSDVGINEHIEEEKISVDYTTIGAYRLINEDGTLSLDDFGYINNARSANVTITKDSPEYDYDEDYDDYEEDDRYDINGERTLYGSTMPEYGVNGDIEEIDGRFVVKVYGKEFYLDEMLDGLRKAEQARAESVKNQTLREKAEIKQEKIETVRQLRDESARADELYTEVVGAENAKKQSAPGTSETPGDIDEL